MWEAAFFEKLWPVLVLVVLCFGLDYYLTLLGAFHYRRGACEHITHEGSYELTPEFQNDVDSLRLVSPRLIRDIIFAMVIITGLWYAGRWHWAGMQAMRFVGGGIILSNAMIVSRHAMNLARLKSLSRHEGVRGKVYIEQWLSYRTSAAGLLGMAGVLVLLAVMTGSVACMGGFVFVGFAACTHWWRSRKKLGATGHEFW
ncbi:MAG: hypothetical protein ACP5HU_06300 [Phycisphaerae bacterium]